MKASSVSAALKSLVAARQPAFIWGLPCLGKSAIIGQLARSLNLALRDMRAPVARSRRPARTPLRGRRTIEMGDPGISAPRRWRHSIS